MSNGLKEPTEQEDFSCHLQDIGMGTLICRAAKQTGNNNTNEVTGAICLDCEVGKVFREVGCDAITPKIFINPHGYYRIYSIFCKIRKINTNLKFCKKCELPTSETTKQIVSTTKSLFEKYDFYSAFQDIEKARIAFRDGNFENAITRSISLIESTMRICHEDLNKPLPDKKSLKDLWKSTRSILEFDKIDTKEEFTFVLNALNGLIISLSGMRSALGDAHGKGKYPPYTSASIAELSINVSCSLATVIIRRFIHLKGTNNE